MLASISYKPIPIFELGPLSLSLHGLFAGIGFVAGGYLMIREGRKRGFDEVKITSILTWGLVGAILGARLFTVPAHLGDPGYGLSDVFNPTGFYSIMGGFAGGVIGGGLRMRMLGVGVMAHLDLASYGMALGTVVGRIGDLLIVEHLGGPTSFSLGYALQPGYEPAPQHSSLQELCELGLTCGPYHHSAVYDMFGAALLLGLLYLLTRYWSRIRYGALIIGWAAWYGLQRFVIDFGRNTADAFEQLRDGVTPGSEAHRVLGDVIADADATLGPLTWNQWSGLAVGVLSLALLVWLVRGKKTPEWSEEDDVRFGATVAASDGEGDESVAGGEVDG